MLEEQIEQRKKKMQSVKQTVQPYIIVVGPTLTQIESYYVCIDDIKYEVNNILNAVDICYKAFQVFNAKYSVDCEQIWTFFQKYIYKRGTKFDKNIESVVFFC